MKLCTILHPTDFSAGSDAAFRYASDFARDSGARLVVLNVVEPPVPITGEGSLDPAELDELKADARRQLHALRPADPGVRVERVLRVGEATPVILDAADDVGADLIVMGTHGRTGVERLFLGSVAEWVLRKSPCPVLTVRDDTPTNGDRPAGGHAALASAKV